MNIPPKEVSKEFPLHVWIKEETLKQLEAHRNKKGYTKKEFIQLVLDAWLADQKKGQPHP